MLRRDTPPRHPRLQRCRFNEGWELNILPASGQFTRTRLRHCVVLIFYELKLWYSRQSWLKIPHLYLVFNLNGHMKQWEASVSDEKKKKETDGHNRSNWVTIMSLPF